MIIIFFTIGRPLYRCFHCFLMIVNNIDDDDSDNDDDDSDIDDGDDPIVQL